MRYIVDVDEAGTFRWYKEGTEELHREDGPAIEYSNGGGKHWYINGKLHREDGPAIEHDSGCKSWYLEGKKYYTEKEFSKKINSYKSLCNGKVVEIDGKKYKLTEV